MSDMGLGGLLAGAIGGALAGKGADSSGKIPSPGGLGSLITGGLGGLGGGALVDLLAGKSEIADIAGGLVGGGVLGTIVTAVVGMLMKNRTH